ncbi:hypothetical protein GCM10009647_090490 [Streptomyces sanglieri]|uniref:Secreted protein n=1 Tax=Streptomyces sanglieri TaxID=193460 RepID=A0ABW2XAF6_9ACTN|nr:hypothetical protein [Streptomyces sp. Wh19]MDV9200976.1 hypothetical protein [Streptomyces sp. Wh19]
MAIAACALAAFLTSAAPVAAATAAPRTTVPSGSSAAQAGEVFLCGEVDPDLPNLFKRNCNSGQWGPVSDFTVIDRRNNKYYCQTGWAEGSLWLQGQGCRRS